MLTFTGTMADIINESLFCPRVDIAAGRPLRFIYFFSNTLANFRFRRKCLIFRLQNKGTLAGTGSFS